MEWVTILAPIFLKLFERCQEDNNKSRANRIKRNGPLVRMRLASQLRGQGYRGKRLRRALNDARDDIASASEEEIELFLDDVEREHAAASAN
jgi:hypothetical protein